MSDNTAYLSELPLRSTNLLLCTFIYRGWKMFCSSFPFILLLNQFICTLPIRRAFHQYWWRENSCYLRKPCRPVVGNQLVLAIQQIPILIFPYLLRENSIS
jgi:hypothetical protein